MKDPETLAETGKEIEVPDHDCLDHAEWQHRSWTEQYWECSICKERIGE